MKMSDRRKDLRPREKLQARGPEALSDYELLMAIIGSGSAQADVTKPDDEHRQGRDDRGPVQQGRGDQEQQCAHPPPPLDGEGQRGEQAADGQALSDDDAGVVAQEA